MEQRKEQQARTPSSALLWLSGLLCWPVLWHDRDLTLHVFGVLLSKPFTRVEWVSLMVWPGVRPHVRKLSVSRLLFQHDRLGRTSNWRWHCIIGGRDDRHEVVRVSFVPSF